MLLPLSRKVILFPAALLALMGGCGDDETPPEDHTPETFTVTMDGTVVTEPFTFTNGETVRVRIQFFTAAGDNLDDVESEHFAGLTFDPTTLASFTRVTGHNYQFDVTGGTPGTGTVTVTFGHEDPPDEHSLPPAAVRVNPSGGGPN